MVDLVIFLNAATLLGIGLGIVVCSIFIFLNLAKNKTDDEKLNVYEYNKDILSQKETDFLSLLNEFRKTKNLQILKADAFSGALAHAHTTHMIANGIISHDSIGIRRDQMFDLGVLFYDEIVGGNYTSIQGLFKAFLKSKNHLKVIIDPVYDAVGLDILADSNGKYYCTVIFIKIKQ